MSTQPATLPSTGFTHADLKRFIRQHFEDFVNRKDLTAADRNLGATFVDHGDDVPPGLPPGSQGAKMYLSAAFQRYPDIHVEIQDMIAEGDKVVVRNHWTATDKETGGPIEFSGIVIWRVVDRKIVERWAYLQKPHPVNR